MSSSDHFTIKLPQKFEKDEEYESWKRDLFIWRVNLHITHREYAQKDEAFTVNILI